jgi:hypothetical protein
MDLSKSNACKPFVFQAFWGQGYFCIEKRPQLAISLHNNQSGILALTSRECTMVALQFEGIHYLNSSAN